MGGGGVLNRQNLLSVIKFTCQWSLKGHFGQSGDLYCKQVGVVICSAFWFLSPGIYVWQCGAVARLTLSYKGVFSHRTISEKKQTGEAEDMELPGVLKK